MAQPMRPQRGRVPLYYGLDDQSVVEQAYLRDGIGNAIESLQKIQQRKRRVAMGRNPGMSIAAGFLEISHQQLDPVSQVSRFYERFDLRLQRLAQSAKRLDCRRRDELRPAINVGREPFQFWIGVGKMPVERSGNGHGNGAHRLTGEEIFSKTRDNRFRHRADPVQEGGREWARPDEFRRDGGDNAEGPHDGGSLSLEIPLPRTTRAGHRGELELTALPLLSAVLARVDLGFDHGQRLLDGDAHSVIACRGMNVGPGHANQDAGLKTWAGFRCVGEPHGRFFDAQAFAEREQA